MTTKNFMHLIFLTFDWMNKSTISNNNTLHFAYFDWNTKSISLVGKKGVNKFFNLHICNLPRHESRWSFIHFSFSFRSKSVVNKMLRASTIFRYSKQLSLARFFSSEKFDAAQQKVKTLKEAPDNDIKLKLYALFKQVCFCFAFYIYVCDN